VKAKEKTIKIAKTYQNFKKLPTFKVDVKEFAKKFTIIKAALKRKRRQ